MLGLMRPGKAIVGRSFQMRARRWITLGTSVAVLSLAFPVSGQVRGTNQAETKPASKPWPPARLPDGQPDVQGFWNAVITGTHSLTNPMAGGAEFNARITGVPVRNPSRIVDPPDGLVPYQPWAAAKQAQQASDWEHPTSIEAEYVRGGSDERYPTGSRIRWDVPARAGMPALKAYWWT